MSNQKTPTTILLTPDRKFHSFGYAARDFYHDLDPSESKQWLYLEKFKMKLHTTAVSNTLKNNKQESDHVSQNVCGAAEAAGPEGVFQRGGAESRSSSHSASVWFTQQHGGRNTDVDRGWILKNKKINKS